MAQGNTVINYELLVIGGSAGSLEALFQLLPALEDCRSLAIVIVIHRRQGESQLAELLGSRLSWPVKDAEEKEAVMPGTIYLAPPDYHLLIEKTRSLSLDFSEKVNYSRPSIDVTFETAAEAYGASVIAILLSGASQDGTEGLKQIKGHGGYVMVQEPREATVAYMPQYAIDNLPVDEIIPVSLMPKRVCDLLLR